MLCLRHGKAINIDTDGRNREHLRDLADRDLLHFDLWLLANLVGGLQIFPGHLPQRRISRQPYAGDTQIEFLHRFRRIHDGKSQKLAESIMDNIPQKSNRGAARC